LKIIVDKAIVLRRINYGEADRIVSLLTAGNGKISVLARGVRKPKSKLAAGIEPFCINEICFAPGRGEIATLTSSRLLNNYTSFINQLPKLELANYILKSLDSQLEDNASAVYYNLLETAVQEINTTDSAQLLELWWLVNILKISGNDINTNNQIDGNDFAEAAKYDLVIDKGGFILNSNGQLSSNTIKLLKLAKNNNPSQLSLLKNYEELCDTILPPLRSFYRYHTSSVQ
jgi:DNA repair protein RecO (recombination protein O)